MVRPATAIRSVSSNARLLLCVSRFFNLIGNASFAGSLVYANGEQIHEWTSVSRPSVSRVELKVQIADGVSPLVCARSS